MVTEKCPTCEAHIRFSHRAAHDCLATYKKLIHEERDLREKYEKGLGVCCPQGHYLYPHRGPAEFHIEVHGVKGGITTCDNCKKQMLQRDKIYWRCVKYCDYDLCHKCVYAVKK